VARTIYHLCKILKGQGLRERPRREGRILQRGEARHQGTGLITLLQGSAQNLYRGNLGVSSRDYRQAARQDATEEKDVKRKTHIINKGRGQTAFGRSCLHQRGSTQPKRKAPFKGGGEKYWRQDLRRNITTKVRKI